MLCLICGMWDLVPRPRELNPDPLGLNPKPLAFQVQSLTYWTTTEVPIVAFRNIILIMSLSYMIPHCSWIKMKLLNMALSSYLGWFCLPLSCLTSISSSLCTSLNVPCSYCAQGSGTCCSFCLGLSFFPSPSSKKLLFILQILPH